jgi:hypothetical protein
MGSLFRSPKAAAPINVAAVGQQQAGENTRAAFQQASFNRLNQQDQFGNTLNYQQTGTDGQGNPIFGVSQNMGQTGQQFAGGFANLGQAYFDRAGNRPDLGSDAAMNRAYDAATSFSAPRQAREMAGLETQLANQGFARGSEAWNNAARDLTERQSSANNTLMAGLQSQMFQQGLADRQQGMSELQPGLQFGMGTMSPNLVNAPAVNTGGPVDYAGLNMANYQQQMNAYNSQMQQRNAMLGGLASIGGSILAAPVGGGMSVGGSLFNRFLGGGGSGWVNPDTGRVWNGSSY